MKNIYGEDLYRYKRSVGDFVLPVAGALAVGAILGSVGSNILETSDHQNVPASAKVEAAAPGRLEVIDSVSEWGREVTLVHDKEASIDCYVGNSGSMNGGVGIYCLPSPKK